MNQNLHRRQFLRTGAMAAGSLTGAGNTLFAGEAAELSQPVAASDRVRFGIVGIGMQGSGLLPEAIRLPGVECVLHFGGSNYRRALLRSFPSQSLAGHS